MTFADNNDGIHNEAYLNGFILDVAIDPAKASDPQPADKAVNIPLGVVLGWTAADSAAATNGHNVFFSKNLDEVKNGAPAAARGAVTLPEFDTKSLPFTLEYGTTYYWRIDEGSSAKGWSTGTVWSFTTEPFANAVPKAAITATASSSFSDDTTPSKTVDGSGLTGDTHSNAPNDMWLAASGQSQPAWIQYEFNKVYCLHEMWVWNYNQIVEPIVGFGLKNVLIEYSTDGTTWTPLAENTEFARAPGAGNYAHNTTVAFGDVPAKYVRITAKTSWGGGAQYGLSEVRFYFLPVQARAPQPASDAADIGPEVVLSWRAGRWAAAHDVYLSTSQEEVQTGTAPVQTVNSRLLRCRDSATGHDVLLAGR